MKIVFIFRDTKDAQYILSSLSKKNIVGDVILEIGGKAKREKLKRIFRHVPLFLYPLKILDVIALLIYSSLVSRSQFRKLGQFEYPKQIHFRVDDVNDEKVLAYLKEKNPDLAFIYGTGLLRESLLKKSPVSFFNIHTGIVPQYRNVHSDFWAYTHKDFSNIGVTIMQLDAGVDSGDILLQKTISYKKGDSLVDIKIKNLKLIVELVTVIVSAHKGKPKRRKQEHVRSKHYPSPGFFDLAKFFFHNRI